MNDKFYIWSGVYKNFDDAKEYSCGDGFESKDYSLRLRKEISELKLSQDNFQDLPFRNIMRFSSLESIVSLLMDRKKSSISIVDFGGGYGNLFFYLKKQIFLGHDIEFKIAELPGVERFARETLGDLISEIEYVSLDDFKNIQCDILVTSSAIQYLKDWKEGLSNFALLRPKYIFFADVFCGNISTFVSLQNYYESKIPQWFLNQDEFVNTVTSHGFKLLSSSVCTAERNSHFTFLDMSNFPQNLQLKYTRNFLFKANS